MKPNAKYKVKRLRVNRDKNEKHLKFIRKLPCLITGIYGVEAAHVRYSDARFAKRNPGVGSKPDDMWTVPLSPEMHRLQHSGNERKFWEKQGINPLRIALLLWEISGDEEQALEIIRRAHE